MDLNNGFKVASIKSKYNYNIFMTNDSKAYNSRNATMATKIKDCRQRTTSNGNKQDVVVVKHNERLRKYAPMDGHIYEAGKTYFFFSKLFCLHSCASLATKKNASYTIKNNHKLE